MSMELFFLLSRRDHSNKNERTRCIQKKEKIRARREGNNSIPSIHFLSDGFGRDNRTLLFLSKKQRIDSLCL
jgi:hypothetical protein